MKKTVAFLLVVMIIATGCSSVEKVTPNYFPSQDTTANTQTSEPNAVTEITTAKEVLLDIPEIEVTDFSMVLQAEDGVIAGDIKLSEIRKGYTGVGYLSGFTRSLANKWSMTPQIRSSQHYNITLIVASDSKKNNVLIINGEDVGEIITSGTGKFEEITFKNIFLDEGACEISIREVTGGIDIDSISIKSNDEISKLKTNATSELINLNSNQKTNATMKYLVKNYGSKIITGQYTSTGTQSELDLVYKTTGHYPAIRMGDLRSYTSVNTSNELSDDIDKAIEWSKVGGMVSYVWHWEAPMNQPSFYSRDTSFDLSKAVTDVDIATLTLEEIQKLYNENKISEECLEIIKDIDIVSEQLLKLQAENATVLWRPLHEAGGGWFWWGVKGTEAYQWLWKLLYQRQTNFHKLNNLIWVWNAQLSSWYVGDDYCDIISADIYVNDTSQVSHVNTYLELTKISNNKLIALSECAKAPSVNFMVRDKAMWSWYGVWSGDYIINSFGELSEKYISKEQLINTYSHEAIITLEQLPDFRTWTD